MKVYATLDDMTALWRPMTTDEQSRAAELIKIVSSSLRTEAKKYGKNLDMMIEADEDLEYVAKSVTVDVVARALMTSTDAEPMIQMSQSALGYSVSGSYLVPGGGLFIKKTELDRLGLRKAKYGVIEFWAGDAKC